MFTNEELKAIYEGLKDHYCTLEKLAESKKENLWLQVVLKIKNSGALEAEEGESK